MEHQFVVLSDLREAKEQSNRRTVRSVAARHVWAQSASFREARRQASRRKKKTTSTSDPEGPEEPPQCENDLLMAPRRTPLVTLLGAGRVDPFRSYPTSYQSYFPELVDHCRSSQTGFFNADSVLDITFMAVDIPELDQAENRGLLRTRWFPFVLEAQSTFKVVMLLAASHLFSLQKNSDFSVNLLKLKQEAIRSINTALVDSDHQSNDWLIASVAKMASYEAIFGEVGSYQTHMNGLNQMIAMRGGLDSLGLSGLLRRIVVWIDINSGFLNGFPRYFPGATFSDDPNALVEPNPARFTAIE